MKVEGVLVLAAVLGVATARAEKSVVEPVYTVTVPETFSNTFETITGNLPEGVSFTRTAGDVTTDCTYQDFFGETSAGTFVKKGAGWLVIDKPLSNWSGQIHVDEGVVRVCVAEGGLGKVLCTSGLPADGDATYVANGATLLMDSSGMDIKQRAERKKIVFEGDGAEGMKGSFIVYQQGDVTGGTSGNQSWWFGTLPTLSGDATLASDTSKMRAMIFNDPVPTLLDLGGHTLRIVRGGEKSVDFNQNNCIVSNGQIVADNVKYHMQNTSVAFAAGAEGSLTLTNGAYLSLEAVQKQPPGPANWTLNVDCPSYVQYMGTGGGYEIASTNAYGWYGPVVLNKSLGIETGANGYGGTFGGVVSGPGGFYSKGGQTPFLLHLVNPKNTFEGGVGLSGMSLALYADGALPADGGSLAITNGNLFVANNGELENYYDAATYNSAAKTNGLCRRLRMDYTLPAAEFSGAGTVRMVSGKAGDDSRMCAPRKPGRWTGPVVKSGAGELVYDAPMGGEELEIREGGVKFGFAGAGLFESHVDFNTTGAGAQQFYDSSVTLTNEVKLVPEMAYGRAASAGWVGQTAGIYEGWLWNREPTNVNWSFAIACNAKAKVVLDGAKVCEGNNNGAKGTVNDVTPGPHHFELRMYTTTGVGGVQGNYPSLFVDESGNKYWPNNTVFWWDPNGCDKTDIHYYRKLEDPGDGSLLSLAADGTPVGCGLLPQFTNITICAGTYLDLNGNGTYEVENLTVGGGEIRNSSTLFTNMAVKVGGKLSFRGTPAENETLLSVAGKLKLAADADVTVDTTDFQKKSFSLLSAEGGIEGWPETVTVTGGRYPERYVVRLSDDGKLVTCTYEKPGAAIIVR